MISAARSAVTIPTKNVEAVAIEKAVWMPSTIAGIIGSTNALASSGTCARIAAPRSPTQVRSLNADVSPRRTGSRTGPARPPR